MLCLNFREAWQRETEKLGLHQNLLQIQNTPQHILIYEKRRRQSLFVERCFTLMRPLYHSKCVTPASIKTFILLLGYWFTCTYISFVSMCIYKVFFSRSKVCSQGLEGFWSRRQENGFDGRKMWLFSIRICYCGGKAVIHWSVSPEQGSDKCERNCGVSGKRCTAGLTEGFFPLNVFKCLLCLLGIKL